MTELERELEGLKGEMEQLAEHLEGNSDVLDGSVDTYSAACLLRYLLRGDTAKSIISKLGIEVEEHGV